jgi:protein-tyrosine phosphatase
MIDLHAHIIPGVDDGARDSDIALRMLRQAYDHGITTVCATPHICGRFDPELEKRIISSFELLKRKVSENKIKIDLVIGSEIHVQQDIQKLKKHFFFTYNDNKKYLLLELPLGIFPPDLENMIFNLRMDDFVPIIAHPERNIAADSDFSKIERLNQLGALFQVNAGSLLGYAGKGLKKIAEKLIQNELATLVASDAHDCKFRSFKALAYVLPRIHRLLGKEGAYKLIYENPKRIIEGQKIENEVYLLSAEPVK